jgi:hypothetical protein
MFNKNFSLTHTLSLRPLLHAHASSHVLRDTRCASAVYFSGTDVTGPTSLQSTGTLLRPMPLPTNIVPGPGL